MKQWVGRWLIGLSVLHTVFAVVVFGEELASIIKRGMFNTVGSNPMTGAVVWFVLFGAMLFICGLAVAEIEKSSSVQIPNVIGWSLLVMAIIGVTLMPVSGFWFVFPPAIAILVKKATTKLVALTGGCQSRPNEGVEQRLDKMMKPHWSVWLCIVISIVSLVVAFLAWQRPIIPLPESSAQIPLPTRPA